MSDQLADVKSGGQVFSLGHAWLSVEIRRLQSLRCTFETEGASNLHRVFRPLEFRRVFWSSGLVSWPACCSCRSARKPDPVS